MRALTERIQQLREIDKSQVDLAMAIMKADAGNFYSLDLVFLAALNRSRSNISAFLQLLEAQNYLGAAPFVRMQLDSILRLYALRLVDAPHDLAHEILKGTSLNKVKDRAGNKMSDAYLRERVAEFEPWVTKVYESGSGFIHLSEKHILSLFSDVGEAGAFQMAISPKQPHITFGQREEAAAAMAHISSIVVGLCKQWLIQKSGGKNDSET